MDRADRSGAPMPIAAYLEGSFMHVCCTVSGDSWILALLTGQSQKTISTGPEDDHHAAEAQVFGSVAAGDA
jgi:hypothetical protein